MFARQIRPDRGILFAQHPGAETLQAILLDQLVSVLESAQVGEEDPFTHLVTIEMEVGAVVLCVPLDFAVVRFGKLQCIGSTDVFSSRIWLLVARLVFLRASMSRIADH